MKCFHLLLGLAQFCWRGEALTDSLSIDFAGQTEVRAVARLARLMTMTSGSSAASFDGRDRAATKIAQLKNPGQDVRALLFEGAEGIRQAVPPIRTYIYVRIIPSKKETRQSLPCM